MDRHHVAQSFIVLVLITFGMGQALAFSISQEIKLGQDVAKEVEKEMPPSKNETWQTDISEMGQRFMPYITRKDIPYHFKVIEKDNELNAFALPGGYVYFTERMWRIMTPDERAAIMAHEITHCDHRHGVDQMVKANQRAVWMLPLLILSGGSAAGYALVLGDAVISQRYSRKMERDADESGMSLLHSAGFDCAGAVTSMKKLLSVETDENRYEVSAIFASHPDTLKRIDYLTAKAISLGAKASDLNLKAVNDPSRIGNVTKKMSELNMVSARTTISLAYGQKVLIKKMLWDDDSKALMPKMVAVATVLTPGKFPTLVFDTEEKFVYGDVMEGDGIYSAPTPPHISAPVQIQEQQTAKEQSVPSK